MTMARPEAKASLQLRPDHQELRDKWNNNFIAQWILLSFLEMDLSRVRKKNEYVLSTKYSILPNKRVYTFISGQVCLVTLIEPKRQTWPEINMYTRLFGSIEYIQPHYSNGVFGNVYLSAQQH